MHKQKGITLIALVITIIVLLILAGISIAMLTGENGILSKAKKAEEQTRIAQYKEQIEIIKAETRLEYNNEVTLEKLKNAFDSDRQKHWVNHTEIISDNNIEKIKLTTNDGYIFYITNETTEYKGKGNVEIEKKLWAEEISLTPEDKNWQVENVQEALDYLFDN